MIEHRRWCVSEACKRNTAIANLFQRSSPRSIGVDVLFQGARRDFVRAVSSEWVRSNGSPHASLTGTAACKCCIVSSIDHIELDFDCASASEVRGTLDWLQGRVSSQHVVHGKHLILIHAAEKVPCKSVRRLQSMPHTLLVLSTSSPDSAELRACSGFMVVRVPCPLASVPGTVRHVLTDFVVKPATIVRARHAVATLHRMGFDARETCLFLWLLVGKDHEVRPCVIATAATLAHAASTVSNLDRRALETLALVLRHGGRVDEPKPVCLCNGHSDRRSRTGAGP